VSQPPPPDKPHRTPNGHAECPGLWDRVVSQADVQIGWLCRCGRSVGMTGESRRRRCPGCGFFRHASNCKWVAERLTVLSSRLRRAQESAASARERAARQLARADQCGAAAAELKAKKKDHQAHVKAAHAAAARGRMKRAKDAEKAAEARAANLSLRLKELMAWRS
jgi:hypothetical protein